MHIQIKSHKTMLSLKTPTVINLILKTYTLIHYLFFSELIVEPKSAFHNHNELKHLPLNCLEISL